MAGWRKVGLVTFWLGFVGLLLLLTGCGGGTASTSLEGTGTITGRVVQSDANGNLIKDDDGNALPFWTATVFIESVGVSTYTNDKGEYSLADVPAGNYVLRVMFQGSDDRQEREIKVRSGYLTEVEDIPFFAGPSDPLRTFLTRFLYIQDALVPLEIRKAISLAIDKEPIRLVAQEDLGAEAHTFDQLLFPGTMAYDDNIGHSYDPSTAAQMLSDYGEDIGTLTLVVNDNQRHIAICELLVEQLEQVGFSIDLVVEPVWERYLERLFTGDAELQFVGIEGATWNGARGLYYRLHSGSRTSSIFAPNMELDRRILNLFALYDREEFIQEVQSVQEYALDRYYSIPLLYWEAEDIDE